MFVGEINQVIFKIYHHEEKEIEFVEHKISSLKSKDISWLESSAITLVLGIFTNYV